MKSALFEMNFNLFWCCYDFEMNFNLFWRCYDCKYTVHMIAFWMLNQTIHNCFIVILFVKVEIQKH